MNKEQIITYIMTTPHNTNWNILFEMLGEGNWDSLYEYVNTTPNNMNRVILEQLLDSGSGESDASGVARVGEARVGIDYVGDRI